MKGREEFLEKLTQDDLDLLLQEVSEADYTIDADAAQRIRTSALEKIRGKAAARRFPARRLAAAILLAASLSLLSPQVQAQVRRLVSLIPGIGLMERQTGSELYQAQSLTVTKGEGRIMGQPVILAGKEGIHLTLQLRQSGIDSTRDFAGTLERFRTFVNGQAFGETAQGMVSGSEAASVYKIFVPGSAAAGDVVRFENDSLGIAVEGRLQTMKAEDPLSLPHASLAGITVIADPARSRDGWDLHMYSMSDQVIPLSFRDSFEFTGELFFETSGGARYPVERPASYGTGFMPPLTVKGDPGKGELVIPSVSYSTDDTASYALQVPARGEVIEPEDGFALGGVPVRVDRIYRSPEDPKQISLDLSWTSERLSLDFFWIEGTSSSLGGDGKMTVNLRPGVPAVGSELTISQPEFTLKQEVRIPLDLD